MIIKHPSVLDVAVVGVNDKEGQEIPKAFVTLRGGEAASVSEKDIMDFVASQVDPIKKIREVKFITTIPRSASGKILRRELKLLK